MGNLLGSPITEKETHTGETVGDDEKLKYGLSSMQGWRVHMEDAHIAEVNLYALETTTTTTTTVDDNKKEKKKTNQIKIPIKGHSLFACYDGHGGTFAAIYSGNNFLRILSKQTKFVEYAKLCEEKKMSSSSEDANNNNNNNNKNKNERVIKLDLLEKALKQAFVETDYEIALAIRGKPHADANLLYHQRTNEEDGTTTTHIPNAAIEEESGNDSGTTACVVIITPDSIVCANAGDSRAVFARRAATVTAEEEEEEDTSVSSDLNDKSDNNTNSNTNSNSSNSSASSNKAIPLSFDHKPDDEEETRRIRAAGGYVAGGRVEGDLAVSRGLGDFRFKQMAVVLNNTQLFPSIDKSTTTDKSTTEGSGGSENQHMATDDEDDDDDSDNNSECGRQPSTIFPPGKQKVSPIPDVIVHTRRPIEDEYIIVACDGIWDVVSNAQCVHEIDQIMYVDGEKDLGLISEEILDSCLQFGSKDNMTAIVIQLPGCEKSYTDAKTKAVTSKVKQDGVLGRRKQRQGEGDNANANAKNEGGGGGGGGGNMYADAFDNANANAGDDDVDIDDVDVDPKYM